MFDCALTGGSFGFEIHRAEADVKRIMKNLPHQTSLAIKQQLKLGVRLKYLFAVESFHSFVQLLHC